MHAIRLDAETLSSYQKLFRSSFPNAQHLSAAYLEWLYGENPTGLAVGYDMWEGATLAAHYACIPVDALVDAKRVRVMLSLNTATHPDFQGKGLFTQLAEATYEEGARLGVSAVYGVANANSTPGFIRKLGFTQIGSLDARIGIGRLDSEDPQVLRAGSSFCRHWTPEALRWRVASPARRYRLVRLGGHAIGAEATTGRLGISAWDELPLGAAAGEALQTPSLTARLHLGLRPRHVQRRSSWIDIPQRFRPSPLNMIFRPLGSQIGVPDRDAIVLGQLDFDAF